MKEKALNYLMHNYLLHVDMIECIKRDICIIRAASDQGVLIEVDEGDGAMLSCQSADYGLALPGLGNYKLLVLHQTQMRKAFCERFGFMSGKDCRQWAYLKPQPLEELAADIRPLGLEYVQTIADVYFNNDLDYLRYLIQSGVMYGIFEGEALAGFIGRHSEGSIGLLEVLPQYRRRGYAEALERWYVNAELKLGHVPYGQLFVDNDISMHLQKKLGMDFALENICWLMKD